MADRTLQDIHPFLKKNDTKTSSGGTLVNYSHDHGTGLDRGSGKFVFETFANSGHLPVALSGYPESTYMWRHVVPLVKDKISLFIPELPGYGFSSLPPASDKRTVGGLIMEALQQVFANDRPVIFCGHDRGARIGHRLLVDNNPSYNIMHAILMDIVPTLVQFRAFANPKASVAYFHWPFLARDIAPQMIEQMGGGFYCNLILNGVKGGNEDGIESFKKDHAWDHYCHQFSNPECIAGSCADYQWGATGEPEAQEDDQKQGKKIKIPTMVLYSSANLGGMHDVPGVWQEWIQGDLKCYGAPEKYGHFLPEECPEWTAKHVIEWIDHFG